MIADIFGANALTESSRMGIAEGRARGADRACPRSPDLTTSSEGSFSISYPAGIRRKCTCI
jgi:hypothetical protein